MLGCTFLATSQLLPNPFPFCLINLTTTHSQDLTNESPICFQYPKKVSSRASSSWSISLGQDVDHLDHSRLARYVLLVEYPRKKNYQQCLPSRDGTTNRWKILSTGGSAATDIGRATLNTSRISGKKENMHLTRKKEMQGCRLVTTINLVISSVTVCSNGCCA